MDAQTQSRANLLQLALQRLSSGMPNAAILAPPQVSMGGQSTMGGRAPLADLQPPQTSAPANVYGYPEGLPPEIRGVYNATQPFSRGMQGQMNMVDNMNNAYAVQDELGSTLRSFSQQPPRLTDMGTSQSGAGESGAGGSMTSETPASQSPKAKPSGAGASGSRSASSAGGKESSGGSKLSPESGTATGADNALSLLRKQRSGGMWDTLGTGVSLVQRSLMPEKGGLKSRTEYDRLLRGSDNYKKLSGDDQQKVRQAFAQWMDEQSLFKGKA